MIGDQRVAIGSLCWMLSVYTLVNANSYQNIKNRLSLSMKDLNTSDFIKDMDFVDSYKN